MRQVLLTMLGDGVEAKLLGGWADAPTAKT